jgi:hypothetical protein
VAESRKDGVWAELTKEAAMALVAALISSLPVADSGCGADK